MGSKVKLLIYGLLQKKFANPWTRAFLFYHRYYKFLVFWFQYPSHVYISFYWLLCLSPYFSLCVVYIFLLKIRHLLSNSIDWDMCIYVLKLYLCNLFLFEAFSWVEFGFCHCVSSVWQSLNSSSITFCLGWCYLGW